MSDASPITAPPADDALVERWVSDHGAAMFRVAAAILRDRNLAEDAVQESLLKAWRAYGRAQIESERGWLLRITHNSAISQLRKERTVPIGDDSMGLLEGFGGDAESEAIVHQTQLAMLAAIAGLDPVTASILVLREIEDLSYEDICDVTELPLPTVKTRLHRGRLELRKRMQGWES